MSLHVGLRNQAAREHGRLFAHRQMVYAAVHVLRETLQPWSDSKGLEVDTTQEVLNLVDQPGACEKPQALRATRCNAPLNGRCMPSRLASSDKGVWRPPIRVLER